MACVTIVGPNREVGVAKSCIGGTVVGTLAGWSDWHSIWLVRREVCVVNSPIEPIEANRLGKQVPLYIISCHARDRLEVQRNQLQFLEKSTSVSQCYSLCHRLRSCR